MERGTENPTLDMLIKLSNALEVEMWEMFDFGHIAEKKTLKESLQNFLKTADESTLRLALKIIRAVSLLIIRFNKYATIKQLEVYDADNKKDILSRT